MSEARSRPSARRRKTSRAVRIADRIAGLGIRLAGLGTIGAVSLVCVFLLSVTAPLFRSQHIRRSAEFAPAEIANAKQLAVDDYEAVGWAYTADAHVRTFDVRHGAALRDYAPFDGNAPTASAIEARSGRAAFGFADGTVRLARLTFTSSFQTLDSTTPPALAALSVGERAVESDGVAERVSEDQFRLVRFAFEVDEPLAIGDQSPGAPPVALLDEASSPSGPTLASVTSDCRLWLRRVYKRTNWLTGEEIAELSGGSIVLERCLDDGLPQHVLLAGSGDNVYLLWRNGLLVRVDARDLEHPRIAEQLDVVDGPDVEVSAASFLIGRKTLVVGDSAGRLRTWFRIKPEGATTVDGSLLVSPQLIQGPSSPVTAIAPSSRSRLIAVGFGDGSVRVVHVTSGKVVGRSDPEAGDEAVGALALAPKDNAVFVLSSGLTKWAITPGHPEATVATLLRPVWYEGYPAAAHVWQSSSGSDEFEPKLGLVPLIFGTLKATVYSMLFGAPLALLAAIYSSEFLHPRVRARVKPVIELMASLPSVVLGFLAAIVFAPMVENVVPQLLTAALAAPMILLLAAHLLQVVPPHMAARLKSWRVPLAAACLPAALLIGFAFGGWVERGLFAGNFKLWLEGKIGSGAGAWTILLLPAAALAVTVASGRWAARYASLAERVPPASLLLIRFVVGTLTTVILALAVAGGLASIGLDPRGWMLGTYVQRNAMVVGFVMGFAIIPIIYTISEDALSSVPEHLRAGSLALGATRWQTAMRIVVPTAMSGLFSALMIGLGRAVGETMIVLMAAGNTPILDWNIFSGLRTLSANIAVELPEAVRNSTHYRTLFLAALVLFAMTFTINTVAELIRLRFRRRAYQL